MDGTPLVLAYDGKPLMRRLLVPLIVLLGGCATLLRLQIPGVRQSEIAVPLHGHALKVRVSMPQQAGARHVLLVYATGDAGWFGKDRAIFGEVAGWGYPAAGFSAREYVHHIGKDPLRPPQVAGDFAQIIAATEHALSLDAATRVILVGKSRGAGLAVAAAGPPALRPELEGVIAVGLTREEEYVRHRIGARRRGQMAMLETYSYLPRLGLLPVAVIQSTRDEYVPAEEARRLFGLDTPQRHLVPVDAENHNFDGAVDTMYAEMERAFHWIVER